MKRQFTCIAMLVRMKLSHRMVFRLGFFGAFFVDGSLLLSQVFLFHTIYAQVGGIGGWSQGEMLIFIGTFALLNAISMTLCFFGVLTIPQKIISGELDLYLTKPMNPLLRLTFEHVDMGSFPLVFLSIGIVAHGVSVMGVQVPLLRVLGYVALVLLMAVLYYDVELLLRILPFFFPSMQQAWRLEELLEMNMRLPGTLFQGVWKVLFYLVLPYGLMATVPAQCLTGALRWQGLLYAVGLVLCFTVGTLWLWRAGLRSYRSASS